MKNRKEDINKFISDNYSEGSEKVAKMVNKKFGLSLKPEAIRKRIQRMGESGKVFVPHKEVERDRRLIRVSKEKQDTTSKYKVLLEEVERLERESEAMRAKSGNVFSIPNKVSKLDGEAVAVVLASDFHLEELVKSQWVGGLNEYNLTISKARAIEFFQNTVKLLKKEQQAVNIKRMVLWLGGDFITGNIHDENMETAQLLPIEAMIFAETILKSGIEFLLSNTDVSLVIPCNAGNHSRITKKQRHSTDVGNSLETIMYHHLAEHFKANKRVRFVLQSGYHLILPIFDNYSIRFHHGHNVKYGGGIGGLYIPAKKAISQWQKSNPVQLDCFGHLHTMKVDTDFISNGSLIGYSPFAVAIKADFEKPQQAFFLIDRKRGRTIVAPISFSI